MTTGDKIWFAGIVILAAWIILHQTNLSRGTQAFGDELLDFGLDGMEDGLFG